MIDPIDLHALADGELSAEAASEMRRNLAENPDAKSEFETIVSLKQCLATRVAQPDCRSEWKACQTRIQELHRSRRVERVVGRYAWALCGCFFMFILAGGIAHRGIVGNRVGSEDVVQAATNLVPTRTPPRDSQAVNAYLDALLGEASRSLVPGRLQVVGGARGELNGHQVTSLTLRDADGDTALMVVFDRLAFDGMPTLLADGTPYRCGSADGINMVAWQVGGASAFLIGNRDHRELASLAKRISLR